jgi:hypothetical protein
MDQFLDQLEMMIWGVMDLAAGLGPTGGLLAAISATAILVWIVGRFLRIN